MVQQSFLSEKGRAREVTKIIGESLPYIHIYIYPHTKFDLARHQTDEWAGVSMSAIA